MIESGKGKVWEWGYDRDLEYHNKEGLSRDKLFTVISLEVFKTRLDGAWSNMV